MQTAFFILAFAEIIIFVASGVYLFDAYKGVIPHPLRKVTPAFAMPLLGAAAGVLANILLGEGLTPGVVVYTLTCLPGAVIAAWIPWSVIQEVRQERLRGPEGFSG